MAVLTPAQYTALFQDITVTHGVEFADLIAAVDDQSIADAYNALATPTFWVWRTSATKDDLVNKSGPEGSTFTWVGNGFITRSVGEQAAWREMFDSSGRLNPSLPQVRQAFQDIFSGTGNAASNRAHLAAVGRRQARRVERLFATGTGSTASPGVLVIEGTLTYLNVAFAFGRGTGE